jgi:hypothetical protein
LRKIENLRELLAKATPREWKYIDAGRSSTSIAQSLSGPNTDCDAQLIVELVNNADALLRVVEAAKGIQYREAIGGYGHEGIPALIEALQDLDK